MLSSLNGLPISNGLSTTFKDVVSWVLERNFIWRLLFFYLFVFLIFITIFYPAVFNEFSLLILCKEDQQYCNNFYDNDAKYILVWRPQIIIWLCGKRGIYFVWRPFLESECKCCFFFRDLLINPSCLLGTYNIP